MSFPELSGDLLPAHKAGLTISHNEHLSYYQSIEEAVAEVDVDEWVSPRDKDLALRNHSLWILRWYPKTPVGFCQLAAASLERLLTYANRARP